MIKKSEILMRIVDLEMTILQFEENIHNLGKEIEELKGKKAKSKKVKKQG